MELQDRIALVTGAARGIGAAVVDALSARGARVAAVDVDATSLERTVAAQQAAAHRVVAYPADVRDSAAVDTLVKRVEHELGPIAVLANVAGVLRTGPVSDLTDEDWAAVFAVNTTGVLHVSRAVARAMMEREGGAIVTVTSNAGGVPRMNMAAYAASKAATAMFTKCLGLELAGHKIRCNVVAPGSTDTPMLRGMWGGPDGPDGPDGPAAVIAGAADMYKVGIPLRRLAEPSDVAEAVAFLASDRARHITMQDLYVDGGAALRG